MNCSPELAELFPCFGALNSCEVLDVAASLHDGHDGWFIRRHEISVALFKLISATLAPELVLELADLLDRLLLLHFAVFCQFVIKQEAQLDLAMTECSEVRVHEVEQVQEAILIGHCFLVMLWQGWSRDHMFQAIQAVSQQNKYWLSQICAILELEQLQDIVDQLGCRLISDLLKVDVEVFLCKVV